MGKHQHTTLVIPDEERIQLEQMARELGLVQTRGAGAGKLGSISRLVCVIARGKLKVIPDDGTGEIQIQVPQAQEVQ